MLLGGLATLVQLLANGLAPVPLAAPDPRSHIQFLATSDGAAVFIRTAKGGRILIDGSNEPSALLGHLGGQLPFWDRQLDLLVATNVDERNLASLNAVLERFTSDKIDEKSMLCGCLGFQKPWFCLFSYHSREGKIGNSRREV